MEIDSGHGLLIEDRHPCLEEGPRRVRYHRRRRQLASYREAFERAIGLRTALLDGRGG